MELGICRPLGTLEEFVDGKPDYVEENVCNFLVPNQDEAAFVENRERALGSPVPVKAACCFLPRDLKCTGDAVDMDALVRYAETTFRRANEIGMEIIVFGSGGSRDLPEGFPKARGMEQFVEVLKRFGPLGEKHAITLVVEPLSHEFINSLAEGAEMVERCDHPNVRLLADAWHMAREQEPAEEILQYGHLLRHCHIAELEDRAAPGTRGDDFAPFFKALKEVSYHMRVSMECAWNDVPAESKTGFACLRDQLAQAGC